jgi:DNA-binding LacI/PurR family transcriptional regulator
LTIPRDVAVLAFAGRTAIACSLRPTLSTMVLPSAEMGGWAARYLTDHLELEIPLAPECQTIASTYVERGST